MTASPSESPPAPATAINRPALASKDVLAPSVVGASCPITKSPAPVFLSVAPAGVVIVEMHEEHDMFRMGGLRHALPVVFWTFLAGSSSLAAVPLITAGFYSKDLILFETWASPIGGPWLWLAGLAGALLTSIYTFRMVFVTFFGARQQKPAGRAGWLLLGPLVVASHDRAVGTERVDW